MYQAKVSVDEQRTVVSFYEDETLLYRTLIPTPYHITEQDPLVQRKKFKERRTFVPPKTKVWVPGKYDVRPWFRSVFVCVNKLVDVMPFRDKEIKYSIHTPYSNQVSGPIYTATEGFKSEELDPHTLSTRAIKSITTSFGAYPLSPTQDATWKIIVRPAKTNKNVIFLRAHYSNRHILVYLANLLRRDKRTVTIRPSFTMDKHTLEICSSSRFFWMEQESWASLDIYLQNPKAYQKSWWQKWFKKDEDDEKIKYGYADSIWSWFKR